MTESTISEFILLGFSCSHSAQLLLIVMVLACYTTILLGNFLIMVSVWSEPKLHQAPMYFFLANLSIIDMSMGSVAALKLVTGLLNSGSVISYGGCMAQLFGLHLFGGAEMFVFTLMAYDRYVAICHPLRYTAIMVRQRCFSLLIFCWTGAFIHSTVHMVVIAQLPFCGPNVLENFFCDIPQVIKLACAEIYVVEKRMLVSGGLITLPNCLTLLVSYVIILASFCGRFGKGGRKALSTCSSHLTIVDLLYGPVAFVYLKPFSDSQVDKIASVFYMIVIPALNPLIYTLRNQEMKGAKRMMNDKCQLLLLPHRE
ncbi:olfactory receptor 4Q3-like [Tiliqua scincoides]|uniref:olfactory receptor 4Q3-like n=1 Tax=Tiliqua scincoides TaxID=71010 RepID=UPI003461D359